MSEGDRGGTSEIPTSQLVSLTRAVARMEGKVDTIKDDLLPPIAVDAKEARDGVLTLSGRVEALETAPDPVYHCSMESEIGALEQSAGEHGEELAKQGEKVLGLSRWRRTFAAVLIPLTLAAAGAAAAAIDRSATNRERASSNAEALKRHEDTIKALAPSIAKTSAAETREIIRAVKAVPKQVQIPAPDFEMVVESASLTDEERRRIRLILARAEKRNGGDHP